MNLIEYYDLEISNLWNDYAETRNKGLKKNANVKLQSLIQYLNTKSKEDRKKFVDYLCIERFEKQNIKDFQQPIIEGLIIPILVEKIEEKKMPYLRWMYQLNVFSNCNYRKIDNFEYYVSWDILLDANKIDPSDINTVCLLLNNYIDRLWYGSHHLPEFILIEENEVDILLEQIDYLLVKYKTEIKNIKSIVSDAEYYRELYKSWFEYKKEDLDICFVEWCENNKKEFYWIKAYYYDKS